MRIQNKLFLTLLATSIIVVVILVMLMQWSVGHGMVDYINKREVEKLQPMIADLAVQYGENGSWQWLKSNPTALRQLMFNNLLASRHGDRCEDDEEACRDLKQPGLPSKAMSRRKYHIDIAITDLNDKTIVAIKPRAKDRSKIAIDWQGKTVGWVSIPQYKNISEGVELLFIEQQRHTFWLMSFVVMVLAGVIGFPLARHFVKPIEQLTAGANQLTQGKYNVYLPTKRNDELGQLTRDFNELAHSLEHNEGSRKRWVADISHELRTPLAILSGEIEAMLDGVRPLSKDGVYSMKEEVDHLSKLVNDLYELTIADIGGLSYRKTEVNLVELVKSKLKTYQPLFDEHNLKVRFDSIMPVIFWADSTRINQLLDNLLTNTDRYTNEGGLIHVAIQQNKQFITLLVEDSAPGVSDAALMQLFDYLYRTEQSRNRESGGSGLGLAICKRIVEGHGGTLAASHSPLGGVAIHVQFPV